MAPNGAGKVFIPANPDLPEILGDMDLDFVNFYCLDFVESRFLDFQVPRSQNSKISGFPGSTLPFPVRRGPFTNLPNCALV